MRTLLACLGASVLSGCFGSTAFVDSVDPCASPVVIPERWLSDQEIEIYWSRDRRELLNCGGKVEVLSGRTPDN
jgi:hypothetical protein